MSGGAISRKYVVDISQGTSGAQCVTVRPNEGAPYGWNACILLSPVVQKG